MVSIGADGAPTSLMLAWGIWHPRSILGLAESAYGDDGAPAAMMLAQKNDMQWYCVEQARSFNDLSTVIANGDYLHAIRCFKSQPSASFPAGQLNHIASGNLLLADLRVNIAPFHSTTVPPSESLLTTIASMLDQSNPGYSLKRHTAVQVVALKNQLIFARGNLC